jgi:hypothetical protein
MKPDSRLNSALEKLERANLLVIKLNASLFEMNAEIDALKAELGDLSSQARQREKKASAPAISAAQRSARDGFISIARNIARFIPGKSWTASGRVNSAIDSCGNKPWIPGMSLRAAGDDLFIEGWAFKIDASGCCLIRRLSLTSGGRTLEASLTQRKRPDLVAHFSRSDVINAGFIAQIGAKGLTGSIDVWAEFEGKDLFPRYKLGSFTLVG